MKTFLKRSASRKISVIHIIKDYFSYIAPTIQ